MHKIIGGVMELTKKEWNGKRQRSVLEKDIYAVSITGGSFVSEGIYYPFVAAKVLASGNTEQEVKDNILKGWYHLKEHII